MAHTSAASSRLNWRTPADLNVLVRFVERRNLVSVRVPSHFNWPLTLRPVLGTIFVEGQQRVLNPISVRCKIALHLWHENVIFSKPYFIVTFGLSSSTIFIHVIS